MFHNFAVSFLKISTRTCSSPVHAAGLWEDWNTSAVYGPFENDLSESSFLDQFCTINPGKFFYMFWQCLVIGGVSACTLKGLSYSSAEMLGYLATCCCHCRLVFTTLWSHNVEAYVLAENMKWHMIFIAILIRTRLSTVYTYTTTYWHFLHKLRLMVIIHLERATKSMH